MTMAPEPDEFDSIINGLEIEVEASEITDVSTLTTIQLITMEAKLVDELGEMKQLLNPTSSGARDKHSLRNAIQIELRKRED